MTAANKITIVRILLVPAFVAAGLYYGQSVTAGQPDESLRAIAITIFVVAAASDGIDGFIARRFNQRSRLGLILDPIADKSLMVSALVVLSIGGWPENFPLWFPVVVIARDVITVAGALIIHSLIGGIHIAIHWSGKLATLFQILAIAWVMFRIPFPPAIYPTVAAAIFTVISGFIYSAAGIRQFHQFEATHGEHK